MTKILMKELNLIDQGLNTTKIKILYSDFEDPVYKFDFTNINRYMVRTLYHDQIHRYLGRQLSLSRDKTSIVSVLGLISAKERDDCIISNA